MSNWLVDRITGMLTGMLAGYLVGMVFGFTAFDPDLDAWALFGFLGAFVGLLAGLLSRVRRSRSLILGATIGFYAGQLLSFAIFGDDQQNGLDLLGNGTGGFVLAVVGILLGGGLGRRYASHDLGYILFAAVFGGFIGGAVFGVALKLAPAQTMWGWFPAVLVSALVCGGLVAWRLNHDAEASR